VRKREAIADTGASKVVVAGVTVVAMLVGVAGFLTWEYRSRQWVGNALAAQKAAVTAGVNRRIAAQFAAALGEMASNIHEHSDRPATGIAAYRVGYGEFEFAVADRGNGILANCRAALTSRDDHGQALRLALTDGVSRYGPQAKRGGGFRPIFVGLANLSGALRFRSGDHALVIDGQRIGAVAAPRRRAWKDFSHQLPAG
jgi:hypothetical protein